MRTSFHHQPEAQHPNFPLSTSGQADYPIFRGYSNLWWVAAPDRPMARSFPRHRLPHQSAREASGKRVGPTERTGGLRWGENPADPCHKLVSNGS
jgi:hypothetical protein